MKNLFLFLVVGIFGMAMMGCKHHGEFVGEEMVGGEEEEVDIIVMEGHYNDFEWCKRHHCEHEYYHRHDREWCRKHNCEDKWFHHNDREWCRKHGHEKEWEKCHRHENHHGNHNPKHHEPKKHEPKHVPNKTRHEPKKHVSPPNKPIKNK